MRVDHNDEACSKGILERFTPGLLGALYVSLSHLEPTGRVRPVRRFWSILLARLLPFSHAGKPRIPRSSPGLPRVFQHGACVKMAEVELRPRPTGAHATPKAGRTRDFRPRPT